MPTTPESSQRSLDCATVIGPSAGTHACRVRLPSCSSSDDDRLDRSRLAGTAVFSACTSPLPPEVHVDPILLSQPLSSSSAIHASSRELYRGTPMFVGEEDADPAMGEAAGQTSSTGVSSPNSVGGHHLSLTHAECFMKQSCSEREEHFYEAVHPFQSFLIEKCLRSGRKVEVCGVDAETHSEAGGSEVGAGQDSQSDTEVDSETCLSPATTTTTPSNLHTPALPQFELAQSPTQPDSPPRHVLWDLQVPSSSCNLPVAGRWWRYRFKDYSRGDMTAYEIQRRYAVAGELQRRHALAVSFAQSHGEGEENHSDGAPSNLSVDARQGARTEKWEGSSEAKSCDTAVIVDEDAPHKREEERVRALRLLAPFIPRYYGIRPMRRDNLYAYMAGARRFASPITSPGTTTLQTPTTDTHQTPSITTPPLSLSSIDTSFSTGGSATVLGSRQETLPMKASASLEDEEPMPKCDYIKLLVLEDVCFGFKHPCVLDMKMGSRQYGLRPSAAKKRSKERKSLESTSGQHGIRLAGYKRWNETTQRFECKSKLACRNLSLDQLHEELCTFFMHSRRVMAHFARQLEQLRIAFSQQTVYRFYTSSLLFVYDADKPQGSGRLVMVDFAYTYEKEELQLDKDEDAEYRYDVRYIKALDTLLSLLT